MQHAEIEAGGAAGGVSKRNKGLQRLHEVVRLVGGSSKQHDLEHADLHMYPHSKHDIPLSHLSTHSNLAAIQM